MCTPTEHTSGTKASALAQESGWRKCLHTEKHRAHTAVVAAVELAQLEEEQPGYAPHSRPDLDQRDSQMIPICEYSSSISNAHLPSPSTLLLSSSFNANFFCHNQASM